MHDRLWHDRILLDTVPVDGCILPVVHEICPVGVVMDPLAISSDAVVLAVLPHALLLIESG